MATFYTSDGKPGYDCKWSRVDGIGTPGCGDVMGEVIEHAVAARLLEAVAPEQIALALKPLARSQTAARAHRAQLSRASSAPATTPRAPSAPSTSATPDDRLVARSLESRWEAKLRELQDADAELARQVAALAPPARAEIEAQCAGSARSDLRGGPSAMASLPRSLLCAEATSVQVQALSTGALEAEGLLR